MTQQSRWIKGTLTMAKDKPFTTTKEERLGILETLSKSSGSYEWSLLSLEKHKDETPHYHFIICFRSPQRVVAVKYLRTQFDALSKTNEIKLGRGQKADWLGYIMKDNDYTVDGDPTVKLQTIALNWKKKHCVKQLQELEGVSERKEVLKDLEIRQWLISFMNTKGYKVNYHTRQLYGVNADQFFQELHVEGFQDLFGDHGLKYAERHITERIYYDLPMWKPDLDWVQFKDAWWQISTGEYEPNGDEPLGITPVRVYDCDLPRVTNCPPHFLSLIRRMGWDLEEFRLAYGRQFQAKSRRDRGLLIYGKPFSGKSTMILPFLDVYRDMIGEWVDDGGFAYANIAMHPFVYSEEVNIFDPRHNRNAMKKLLEGVEFSTRKKHTDPAICIPKTMMIVTNDTPPAEGLSVHTDALRQRLDIYQSGNPLTRVEADQQWMELIKAEAPKILLWATAA